MKTISSSSATSDDAERAAWRTAYSGERTEGMTICPYTCEPPDDALTRPRSFPRAHPPFPLPLFSHFIPPPNFSLYFFPLASIRAAKLGQVLEHPAKDYHESADRLSGLIKTGLLKFTDLKEHPSKFFEAHRLLVNHGFEQG
jgi:hypothetical protein